MTKIIEEYLPTKLEPANIPLRTLYINLNSSIDPTTPSFKKALETFAKSVSLNPNQSIKNQGREMLEKMSRALDEASNSVSTLPPGNTSLPTRLEKLKSQVDQAIKAFPPKTNEDSPC